MHTHPGPQSASPLPEGRWSLRDSVAATCLFVATAAVVLWQNTHLVILWDLSYVLDSSVRIALGQVPYRDFPFAHAPLTFLIQSAIIRFTGRVFFHHVLYAATVGGLGTILAWRIVLHTLRERMAAGWAASLLLAAPLTVLGIYCILPHPSYDCDCAFSILIAIRLLQRLMPDLPPTSALRMPRKLFNSPLVAHPRCSPTEHETDAGCPILRSPGEGWDTSNLNQPRVKSGFFQAGAAVVVPLFFKQNIGLPLLAVTLAAILLLLFVRLLRRSPTSPASLDLSALLAILAGAGTTLLAAGLLLHYTLGLGNYFHWTIQFAAQRRLPGFKDILGVYLQPSLLWMLPCVALGLVLLRIPYVKSKWARVLALGLLAAPFFSAILALLLYDDADQRGDSLLALWPLLLLLSGLLTLFNLCRGLSLRALLPAILLVTINGTLLSQQLWGSTYAIWPLLILLIAEMIAFLAEPNPQDSARGFLAPALSAVIAATLLLCGGLYTASEERLSYAQLPEGPVLHSSLPQLAGMSASGPYLPNFDELLQFASTNIPISDGLILIPGEDPFYFATGRVPQFPVLLFDPATDPYSPAQIVEQACARNIHWLIVKRELQIKEDPTPQREAVLQALLRDFTLSTRLQGYDIYRRP